MPTDIASFSYKGVIFMARSNILFPSNYYDKGDRASALFASRRAKGWGHLFGKPLRAVGRLGGITAIGIMMAPLGTLYHGGKLVQHSYSWLRAGDGSLVRSECSEQLKAHLHAFLVDLVVSTVTGTAVVASPLALAGLITNQACIAFAAISWAFLTASSLKLDASVSIFAPADKIVNSYVGIVLKNQFGRVQNDQSLIINSVTKQRIKGEYINKIRELLDLIHLYQDALDAKVQIPFDNHPHPKQIISHLKKNRHNIVGDIDFAAEIAKLTKLGREIDELQAILKKIKTLEMNGNTIIGYLTGHYSLSARSVNVELNVGNVENYFLADKLRSYKYEPTSIEKWDELCRVVLREFNDTNYEFLGKDAGKIQAIKQLLAKNPNPPSYEILGFETPPKSHQQLEKQADELLDLFKLLLQKNGVPPEAEKEFGAIGALITGAYHCCGMQLIDQGIGFLSD